MLTISDVRPAAGARTPPGRMLSVVVADSNWVVRRGLRSILEDRQRFRVVAEARTSLEALAAVDKVRPDALLLVLPRPPCDTLRFLPALAASTRVIVLAETADLWLVATAVQAGAAAFLVHAEYTPGELLRAVGEATRARVHLSPSAVFPGAPTEACPAGSTVTAPAYRSLLSNREREVMNNIARGLSNREIAAALELTEKTVKNYVNRIFAKLAVSSRAQAIVLWLTTRKMDQGQRQPAVVREAS